MPANEGQFAPLVSDTTCAPWSISRRGYFRPLPSARRPPQTKTKAAKPRVDIVSHALLAPEQSEERLRERHVHRRCRRQCYGSGWQRRGVRPALAVGRLWSWCWQSSARGPFYNGRHL